jgi:hypothetical protein
MPGEQSTAVSSVGSVWDPPPAVRRALLPWVDLGAVGPEGFWNWLTDLLPLLPLPAPEPEAVHPPAPSPEARIEELARALAGCAGEHARIRFTASEYHHDNTLLARRVKALEAQLSLLQGSRPKEEPEGREVADVYLPSGARNRREAP